MARSTSLQVKTPPNPTDILATINYYGFYEDSFKAVYVEDGLGNQVDGFDTIPQHFGGVNRQELAVMNLDDDDNRGFTFHTGTIVIPKKYGFSDGVLTQSQLANTHNYFMNLKEPTEANKSIEIIT